MLRICYYCINIKLTAVQVYHCLKVLVIPESAGTSFDILDDTVHSFQNGIGKTILEVIQYLVPMVTDQPAEFFHWLQARAYQP